MRSYSSLFTKSITYSQMAEGKLTLIRMLAPGEMVQWTHCFPKTTCEGSVHPCKFLKGKREVASGNHWNWRGSELSPATMCRTVPSLWSSFRCYLVHPVEGKPEKRSGHLLITNSSFLLCWSYRKNQQVRRGIVWLKVLETLLRQRRVEHGLQVSSNVASCSSGKKRGFLLRVVSCKELPTASEGDWL